MIYFRTGLLVILLLGARAMGHGQTSKHAQPEIRYIQTGDGSKVNPFLPAGPTRSAMGNPPLRTRIDSSHAGRTLAPPVLTVITGPSSCNWFNGYIIASATGGTPPYVFDLNNNWAVRHTGNFPLLQQGTYQVRVTDALGQTATQPATILNDNYPPTVTTVITQRPSTCNTSDGIVTVHPSGGTPPYEYSLDLLHFQSSNVFTGLPQGLYYFYVRDANGCIGQSIIDNIGFLNPFDRCGMSYGFAYTAAGCMGEAQIEGDIDGPGEPYQVSLDGVNFQSNFDYNNLDPGIYLFYLLGANGEQALLAYTVAFRCHLNIDYTFVPADCSGIANGSLTITQVFNGTPPFTYSIDGINFQSSPVFTGLLAGNYAVTVRDAIGQTNSQSVDVETNCPTVTAVPTYATCPGGNDGTITASGQLGTAPYTYSLDGINFQASNIFTGLTPGTYTLTIRDVNGYTGTTIVFVYLYCINVTATATPADCSGNTGSISLAATGGSPPYQYSLDGVNFQTSNTFIGLTPGAYTLTVKDKNGQTGTASAVVGSAGSLLATVNTTIVSCAGNDGTITGIASGGTSPYQFSLDGVGFQPSGIFTGLIPGSYTLWVQDAGSCLVSAPVQLISSCPTVSSTLTPETCGSANGSILASGSGGTAPYQFSIDGTNFQSNPLFSNLAAGSYVLYIKDGAGITNSLAIQVDHICPVLSLSVTDGLCGTAGGSISAVATNGVGPYQFSIDGVNFQADHVFSNLSSGWYTVTVRDALGLTATLNTEVRNFPAPSLSAGSQPATCINNNGVIELLAVGGTGSLLYSLDGNQYQPSALFSGLGTGNYIAWVKDANGCTETEPVVVSLNPDLTIATGTDITICEGKKTVLPAFSNGTGFNWVPATALNNSQLLNPEASPGQTTTYTLTAVLGVCNVSAPLTVIVDPAPVALAGADQEICFGRDANLQGSGGIEYEWSPALYLNDPLTASPVVNKPPASITYTLTVKDTKGCTSLSPDEVTIRVTPPAELDAGADTTIVWGQAFQLMAGDVNNSGFTNYTWSPSFGLNNPNIRNPIAVLEQDIRYRVTAVTAAGCEGTDDIFIKVYKGPEIYVPSAFTPNGDGLNDLLRPLPVGIRSFHYFRVFNRLGQEVFYTTDPLSGWNGEWKGRKMDSQVLVWLAEGVDMNGQRVFRKGTVTIIR